MKFTSFNPSELEIIVSEAVNSLKPSIEEKIPGYKISSSSLDLNKDNPQISLTLTDTDGDNHNMVIAFIHRPN